MELTDIPEPPLKRVEWRATWRIIPSRYPPIQLFERVADAEDLEAVIALESLTNERLRDAAGDIRLVAPEERVFGPGAGYIMAAFTYLNPGGSRFSDGSFGVYYAGSSLTTAIAETRYHRERFLARTQEAPTVVQMRVLVAGLAAELHDLRRLAPKFSALLHPLDYAAGQALGRRLRGRGSWGVVYPSVRHAGGTCVGVFRPRALRNCAQERHLSYEWDGQRIVRVRPVAGPTST